MKNFNDQTGGSSKRRITPLRAALAALIAAVVMAAAMTGASAGETGDDFELGGDAANGETVYSQFCASCHGPGGAGDGPAAAALSPKPTDFTDSNTMEKVSAEQAYTIVRDGGTSVGKSPIMPAWNSSLSDSQIRDVVAYLLTLDE